MHLPEDGHTSGQNMEGEYYVYSIFLYIYVLFLVLLPCLITQCMVLDYLKLVFIVVPRILIMLRFLFLATNAPFIEHIKC